MSKSKGILQTILLVLAVFLFGIAMFWGYLDQKHYFYHVKVAKITSGAWGNHEAKDCDSWNAKSDPPVLECDAGHDDLRQTVPVRFYGDTRQPLDPETMRLHWQCSKDDEVKQPISCRIVAEP
jgi:hypothetical protein